MHIPGSQILQSHLFVLLERIRNRVPRLRGKRCHAAKPVRTFLWVTAHQHQKVVCLEIGVGYNTPGIIKYPFWQQVYQNKNATYACLNMEEEQVPEEIRDRSIVISGDSARVIQELAS